MDISIIITAKNESKTVGPLISGLEQDLETNFEKLTVENSEIILVCPDQKTKQAGLENDRMDLVTWVKDRGQGKPAALNQAFEQAQGNYLILTDGDVVWQEGAITRLLQKFDRQTGLITGRPCSLNSINDILGFWSHFLTFVADKQRKKRQHDGEYFDASGYLLAVKKDLVKPMPKNVLVDDAYLSHLVWSTGQKIGYAPKAKIGVKFPTNFSDWVKQKKRTISGYVQLKQMGVIKGENATRTFRQEIKGFSQIFSYPQSIKEYWWIILLLIARLYVWLLVFKNRVLLKKEYSGNWERIESTK
jgi:cellulose synthase/poly-beta-1,6-N-acetylglucosamine synthase-like glycosyltransferase